MSAISRNMCGIDRIIRILLGSLLVYIGFFKTAFIANEVINLFIGLLGIINIAAGLTAHCPMYSLASINTSRKKSDETNNI